MIDSILKRFRKKQSKAAILREKLNIRPKFENLQKNDRVLYTGCAYSNMTPGVKYKVLTTGELGVWIGRYIVVSDNWGKSFETYADMFDVELPPEIIRGTTA
jgi:hypothetical protein